MLNRVHNTHKNRFFFAYKPTQFKSVCDEGAVVKLITTIARKVQPQTVDTVCPSSAEGNAGGVPYYGFLVSSGV